MTDVNKNNQPDLSQSPRNLFGRTVIYAREAELITEGENINLVKLVNLAYQTHLVNSADINYLWNYYKGRQPILNRTKDVRPEITNKIVENHAEEIVAFKIGYQFAEPLQYTCRKIDDEDGEQYNERLANINELNTLMFAEDKAASDRDLFEWMCVCGVGYRMVESDQADDIEEGSAPYEMYVLDPRSTFVVYSPEYHHKPMFAVWVSKDEINGTTLFNVFTDTHFFLIKGEEIIKSRAHTYKHIPIIEYKLNNARTGAFEKVLPLLDAINAIESNRLDGIEQTVQALMKFVNCDIDETEFKKMLELGAVKVSSTNDAKADVDILRNDLDQTQTQVTKEDLYQAVVNICGMPSRSQGASTSDTGAAVLLRDGWTLAEAHAKSYELQFKRSERDFLRVVLAICDWSKDCDIKLRIRDIELAFNRRNYENILVKSQVLTTMLQCGQIHPELAFQSCGLFTDPEAAYALSETYKNINNSLVEPIVQNKLIEPASSAGQPEPDGSAI